MIARRRRKHGQPVGEDPTTPLQRPTTVPIEPTPAPTAPYEPATTTRAALASTPPPATSYEPSQVLTSAPVRETPGVSEVVGTTVVPQITVGSPSPTVEPVVIAADYSSLPFRPDVVIDGWSTDTMTVRGVSQRGHLHRYNGAPRQDDFAVHRLPGGRVIVLVADGVSGARQSHIGASAAIKQAADWLHSNLGNDLAATDWAGLLKRAELATTLVCAVIEPTGPQVLRAHLVSAGDSAAWLLKAGHFVAIAGGKAVEASGVSSSAVVGLPRLPPEVIPIVVDIEDSDVLLIATDGIGDPLGSGQGGVGNLFRDVLTRPSAPSLIEFAHAVDFSRETFDDDRTLVAVWPRKTLPQETVPLRRKPSAVEGLR
jgi:serine/threonine protein phosphatase PrpC